MSATSPTSRNHAPTRKTGFVDRLASFGDSPALITSDSSVTYEQLASLVDAAGRQLGSTRRLVALECHNDVASLVYYLACLDGSHPVILLNGESNNSALIDGYRPDVWVRQQQAAITTFDAAPAVVSEWELLTARSFADHVLHPDLAVMLSTSGSTGSPKLVRLSHRNLNSNAASIADYLAIRPTDVAALVLPMAYSYGLSVVNSHLHVGAAIWLASNSVVDECFWRAFEEHQATSLAGVPYTFEQLTRVGFEDFDLPSLRYVTQAGGHMPADRVRQIAQLGQRRGWDLFVMYGQTEATARMAYLPPERALTSTGAIGTAIPGGSITIEADELVYRGDNVMMGYATSGADLARGHELTELRTGDLARYTDDGLIEIVGRTTRIAKLFGLRIDLDQVERTAAAAGCQVACVDLGDKIGVVAIPTSVDTSELVAQAAGVPASALLVLDVSEFPRTSSHKVDYRAVRDRLANLRNESASTLPRAVGSTGDRLVDAFAQILNVSPASVTKESSFVDLRGDSLSYVATASAVEDILGRLPTNWHLLSIAELADQANPSSKPRRIWTTRKLEMSVLLRALAVIAVVASHIGIFSVRGGAHVLLALVGYGFARFHLSHSNSHAVSRTALASLRRIAVPALAWLTCLVVFTDTYRPQVLLLNSWLSTNADDPEWRYWFIEALVVIFVVAIAAMTLPRVRSTERAFPYAFALVAFTISAALSFGFAGDVRPHSLYSPVAVGWVFAAGWLVAKSTTRVQKATTLVVCLAFALMFFPDGGRLVVFSLALAGLLFVAHIAVPQPAHALLGWIAAASLFIYLTHYQVYPLFGENLPLALIASVLVGGIAWQSYQWLSMRLRGALKPRCALSPLGPGACTATTSS